MDPLILARLQFAVTTVYHFFFVPLTIGLAIIVAIMETLYVRTGQGVYKRMTKFWGKLFVINFAMGVVTGIVQEFQFGMNWSEYSRFVGDIFGAPLAIEALLAFFLESTFIGLWLFGWDKLSKPLHAVVMWLVAIGSNLSALWILIANSFMQEPVGYVVQDGRAVMNDFAAVVFNPNIWVQFPHVITAGLTTAAFFILGISAYHLVRKQEVDLFKRSFQIAAILGTLAILLVGFGGHSQAQHMVKAQPMKMAAAEALYETEDPASFSLLTIGDLTQRREVFSIRIPFALSLLAYDQMEGEVLGIYELQEQYEERFGPDDYIPPVAVVYWTFRIMVGAGMVLVALAIYALFMVMGNHIEISPRLQKIFFVALFLPYVANSAGWLMTEMGRYPWIVQDLMRVDAAVSPAVSVGELWTSLIGFTLIYGVLMAADIYLLAKYARIMPAQYDDEQTPDEAASDDQAFSMVGAQD
ncbi:MAG: cytochrome ubiquinol oxidase subunit I [Anaerolineales bacterium]|nr:cytochrome ubiquinol oxidase subunit I [Anaerolineales bacterium]